MSFWVMCPAFKRGPFDTHEEAYQALIEIETLAVTADGLGCDYTHVLINDHTDTHTSYAKPSKGQPMYASSTDPVEDIQSAWTTFQEAAGEFEDAVGSVQDPDDIVGWKQFKNAYDTMERYIALCAEAVEGLEPSMIDANITCRAVITFAWDDTNQEPTDVEVDISDITVEDRNGSDRTDTVQGQNIAEIVGNLDFSVHTRKY